MKSLDLTLYLLTILALNSSATICVSVFSMNTPTLRVKDNNNNNNNNNNNSNNNLYKKETRNKNSNNDNNNNNNNNKKKKKKKKKNNNKNNWKVFCSSLTQNSIAP